MNHLIKSKKIGCVLLLVIFFSKNVYSQCTLNASISGNSSLVVSAMGAPLAYVASALPNYYSYKHSISDSVRSATLFDFDNHGINSLLTFIKNEPGDLFQTSKRVDNTIKVKLFYERNTSPNPLKIMSDYDIVMQANGDAVIDMKEVMPLELMHIGEELAVLYEGQALIFPKIVHVNDTLTSASGKFKLVRKIDNTDFLTHEVAVKNRKILKKEILNINGQKLEAYIHAYNIAINVKYGGITYLTRTEEVLEWLIPKYGIVKQERIGNETKQNKLENKTWEYQRVQIIKTLN